MSNVISDSVSKLSAITDQTPIDWDAFDSVLKGLEDINAYDEHDEETILSEFIMDGEFYKRGFILADVVRHFLACNISLCFGGCQGSYECRSPRQIQNQ